MRCPECGWNGGGVRDEGCMIQFCPRMPIPQLSPASKHLRRLGELIADPEVQEWPEKVDGGFMKLLEMRNLLTAIMPQLLSPAQASGGGRGNYEGRHPDDMILWSAADHKDLIEVVAALGIEDSHQTPAEAVRELQAEIERLNGVASDRYDAGFFDAREGIASRSPAQAPSREKIASIIDPTAWIIDDDGNCIEQQYAGESLEKADAILVALCPVPSTLRSPETIPVPIAALDWLFGSKPDADGKWFGDSEDEATATGRIFPPKYWWRSKFRSMVPALDSSKVQGGTDV